MQDLRKYTGLTNNRQPTQRSRRHWALLVLLVAVGLGGLNAFGVRLENQLSRITKSTGRVPSAVDLVGMYEDVLLTANRDKSIINSIICTIILPIGELILSFVNIINLLISSCMHFKLRSS